MGNDKYTAVWVSHSSIGDFIKCPRAYFLKNVYKDPATGNKIGLMSPPMALGQVVHEVVESLSVLPMKKRFRKSLIDKFNLAWEKVSGKNGGFLDKKTERKFKDRGVEMLKRLMNNPGPLKNLAVKIKMDLPYYWISKDDNIILCGQIDWLEYLPEKDSVHIIDFKTGKTDENSKSLQLPIYHLLVHNCQDRRVEKVSYWYLEKDRGLTEKKLPDLQKAHEDVLKIAKKIKLARQLQKFDCPQKTGCYACKPMEKIVKGEAVFVGTSDRRQDMYILDNSEPDKSRRGTVL